MRGLPRRRDAHTKIGVCLHAPAELAQGRGGGGEGKWDEDVSNFAVQECDE
jgi:hypothetical protein